MLERKKILTEVEERMNLYCKDCFLYKHHKEDMGRKSAHRFCITQCTVGEEIKLFGKQLS